MKILFLLLLVPTLSFAESQSKEWCGLYYFNKEVISFVPVGGVASWLVATPDSLKEVNNFIRRNGLDKRRAPAYIKFRGVEAQNTENTYYTKMYVVHELYKFGLSQDMQFNCEY